MKALLALAAAAGFGTAGYQAYQAYPPAADTPAPAAAPAPGQNAPVHVDQPRTAAARGQTPTPPAGLPGSLTCTAFVNGTPAGTFPFAWDGEGWTGTVSVGSSGPRTVFLNLHNGSVAPAFKIGAVTVSPLSEPTHRPGAGFYGGFGGVNVTHEWKGFVGGASVVFAFAG
jgi:hypothetical protein